MTNALAIVHNGLPAIRQETAGRQSRLRICLAQAETRRAISARNGWLWIAALALVLGMASSVVQIAGVVSVPGQVRAGGDPIPVRPETGGKLMEVLVSNGDLVERGQPLLRLDTSNEQALLAGLDARHERLMVQAARLEALIHDSALDSDADPLLIIEANRLLEAERSREKQEGALAQARRLGVETQLLGLERRIGAQERQLAVTRDELAGLRSLLERGLTAQARVRGLERLAESIEAQIAASEGERAALEARINEIEQDQLSRRQTLEAQWLAELQAVQTEMEAVEVERQRTALAARRAAILAPVTGVIADAIVREPGTVVASGETLMSVVPGGIEPVVQGYLAPRDIEKISKGQNVRIDLSPLDPVSGRQIEGRLRLVAADVSRDTQGRMAFAFEVALAPEHKNSLPIGAPVQVLLPTGEESLMSRLLSPLSKRLQGALAER